MQVRALPLERMFMLVQVAEGSIFKLPPKVRAGVDEPVTVPVEATVIPPEVVNVPE